MARNRRLLPPPRLVRHRELPPVIEPPLQDLPPLPPAPAGDLALFPGGPGRYRLTPELARRARETAMSDAEVRRRLEGKRHMPVGCSLIEHSERPEAADLLFLVYDYDRNVTLEVQLDPDARRVRRIDEVRCQPAPTEEEIARAAALACQDPRLAPHLQSDFEVTALVVSPVDPHHPRACHRQLDLRFGYPEERLPRCQALVDLSAGQVLDAGPLHRGRRPEGGS